jgi:hypothetical protein
MAQAWLYRELNRSASMNPQRHQKIGEYTARSTSRRSAGLISCEWRAPATRTFCGSAVTLAAHREARDFISTPAIEVVAAALAMSTGLPAAASSLAPQDRSV